MFETSVRVDREEDETPIFAYRHSDHTMGIRFGVLPAYPFLGGKLAVWRGGNIVLRSTEIAREGPAQLVAFHGMVELQGYFGHSSNLGTRWKIHAYDFIPGDLLVFVTDGCPNLIEDLLRLSIFIEPHGPRCNPSSPPPQGFGDLEYEKKFEELKRRGILTLSI